MTITELTAKRAKAWDDCKAFLEAHRNENGVLNDADIGIYNTMAKIVDDLQAEIDRLIAIEARDAAMAKPTSSPILGTPGVNDKTGRASNEYHEAFLNHIHKKAQNVLQEGDNEDGGYLVPVEFERTLLQDRAKTDPIFDLANRITLGAHEKNVPVVASRGTASLIDENGAYSDSDDSFGQINFKAYKFGRICKASEELIADSAFDIEAYLRDSFARSIGKAQAGYFWTGTGSSQPQGVLTGAGTGVTCAKQNEITADEIIDLYYSVGETYRANAVWVFNDATIAKIRQLKDGNGQYIWQAAFGAQPATILGRPVYTSENIPTIAHGAKVGVFGDLSYYWIADRQGVNFLRLNELYAANGQVGFRGSARSDGHVMLSDAIKVMKMA